MNQMSSKPLMGRLPSVDRLLNCETASTLIAAYGRAEVTRAIREALEHVRSAIKRGEPAAIGAEEIVDIAARALARAAVPPLRAVFNLSGTVLHTNLGRAALPEEAIAAVADVARGASNLEYDLADGRRGDRDSHLEEDLCRLTGAEAATVVNNNAAAVMLVLNTLALGGKVPVSRGELVEIGGSFRIPEIMARSGCTLVEVGTTNRTHLKDFEQAIEPDTALVMKVHTSNYVIEGFTATVPEAQLAGLCRRHGIPFVNDLGAGTLIDLRRWRLPHEPTPMEALKAGADVVTFSGDKLLGGPQAGIIVGRKELVARIKSNPMKRALRCDKMTIAALSAVLRLYADPDRLALRLPTLRLLARSQGNIRDAAERLVPHIRDALNGTATVAAIDCDSTVGSGALPTSIVPSAGIAIRPVVAPVVAPGANGGGEGTALARIARAFRSLPCPVVGRIHDGAFVLDLRCLEDEKRFIDQLSRLELTS